MSKKSVNTVAAVIETVEGVELNVPGLDLEALLGDLGDIETQAEELAAKEKADAEAAALQAIADVEAQAEVPADEEPTEDQADDEAEDEPEVDHVEGDLKEMIEALTDEELADVGEEVAYQFTNRIDYELTKNPTNDRMKDNLTAYSKKMTSSVCVAVLAATDVNPYFINREVSAGSRFNVYALDKVNDLLTGLGGGIMRNAINIAVMRSMFKFRAAKVPFTGLMALAAASDKVKVEKAMDAILIRHTVSASTAPTQSSSTMTALSTLGVVENRGSQKFPLWVLTDTPQTRKLEALLAA